MQNKQQPRRFVAVGDVHGQFEPFLRILRHAKLVDVHTNWIGQNARLLQIGDTIDRGPYSLQVDKLLEKLQQQAAQQKGEVIRLVGNHELELILGNFSISEFPPEQQKQLQQKFSTQVINGLLKAAYAYKGFLFTHAGINQKLARVFKTQLDNLSAANLAILINFIFRESVAHQFYKHPIFNISLSRSGTSHFGGIFWEDLNDLIKAVPKLPVWQVVGHTPIDHIVLDQKLHLIPIDVGMHRKEQYIEIDEAGQPTIITL